MAKQHLHSALAPIDVLTRVELDESLHKSFSDAERSRVMGLDYIRFPVINIQAPSNATLLVGASGNDPTPVGPESGDIWQLRRVNVISSAFLTDTARYMLFRGSAPSDVNNATNPRFVLDGMASAPQFTTTNAPAVPASTVPVQNPTSQPYTVVVSGGTVTAVTVNGQQVGSGDGTFVVPAYGAISVTYSVAPTWTWTATQVAYPPCSQQIGVAYSPGGRLVFVNPGEQIYALVFNPIANAVYSLVGEAIRAPAEMKGKMLD